MKKRVYDDDDGRTVADMSGIERQPLLLPRFHRKDRDGEEQADAAAPEEEWSREDRRAVIFGSIGAVLLIGVIFLAAAAAVIALLLTVWR